MPEFGSKIHVGSGFPREFYLGIHHKPFKFASNRVSTTRYTPSTFLPKSIFDCFKRYANIYFLIAAVMQSIPQISPLMPMSAILPLIIVISISVAREGYEDLQRHRSDVETNATPTRKLEGKNWLAVKWSELKVGDVVRIDKGEFFPADLVLLASSDSGGVCYLMTSSLDGEKNLKPRLAPEETQRLLGSEVQGGGVAGVLGKVSTSGPSAELSDFSGRMELASGGFIELGSRQLLLRGAALCNTDFVLGVVAFAGKESKALIDGGRGRAKLSKVEAATNRLILFVLAAEFVFCLAVGFGGAIWAAREGQRLAEFIPIRVSSAAEGALSFCSMSLLLNTMVPISLVISLEIVKLAQAFFIVRDADMRAEDRSNRAKAFSSGLNEELGQIEYVFTDKTGTLTRNQMEFKFCYIAETLFRWKKRQEGEEFGGEDLGEEDFGDKAMETENLEDEGENTERFESRGLRALMRGDVKGEKYELDLGAGKQISTTAEAARLFFLTLAVTHECMKDGEAYVGPSPDDVALVEAARDAGIAFDRPTSRGKLIRICGGESVEVEVLACREFDPTRRRAWALVRWEGGLYLLCKGADTAISNLIRPTPPSLRNPLEVASRFAISGLRTLLLAARAVPEEEWRNLSDRLSMDVKSREKLLDSLEKDMVLLGATAVEDRLQDEVPRVIADFLQANIRVWMLTGDKLETAESIGHACRLIQPDFKKIYLRAEEDPKEKFEELVNTIDGGGRFALLLEGLVIAHLVKSPELSRRFVKEIFSRCESVLCCRMSPKQKGDVVRMVKNSEGKVTLAIGDGANDCNMIREADVGVGLFGKEGMRAVQASDYAIPEFKHLWKLLFVHGRLSYIRVAEMILYFYHKNIVFSAPMFFFAFLNGFSAQTLFDDFYISSYNLVFTSLPVMIRAVFDQDVYYKSWTDGDKKQLVEAKEMKKFYPQLYHVGQQNLIFNFPGIILWLVGGFVAAAFIFWTSYFAFANSVASSSGQVADLWIFSIVVFSCVIMVTLSARQRPNFHFQPKH